MNPQTTPEPNGLSKEAPLAGQRKCTAQPAPQSSLTIEEHPRCLKSGDYNRMSWNERALNYSDLTPAQRAKTRQHFKVSHPSAAQLARNDTKKSATLMRRDWLRVKELKREGVEENPGPPMLASTSAPPPLAKEKEPLLPPHSKKPKYSGKGAKSGHDTSKTCFLCGAAGHFRRNCPKNKAGKQGGENPEGLDNAELLALKGANVPTIQSAVSQADFENAVSLAGSRYNLGLNDAIAFVQRFGDVKLDIADGDGRNTGPPSPRGPQEPTAPPAPQEEVVLDIPPEPQVEPVFGQMLTEAELDRVMNRKPWFIFVYLVVAILAFLTGVCFKMGFIGAMVACALSFCVTATLAWTVLAFRWDIQVEGGLTQLGVDHRLRTVAHVNRLDRPVRVHRYRMRKHFLLPNDAVSLLARFFAFFRPVEMNVVDHWVSVAMSEFAYGQELEPFLKNVHLKYLRCGELSVDSRDFVLYKEGTTEYLRLLITERGFRMGRLRSWQPDAPNTSPDPAELHAGGPWVIA